MLLLFWLFVLLFPELMGSLLLMIMLCCLFDFVNDDIDVYGVSVVIVVFGVNVVIVFMSLLLMFLLLVHSY